MYKNKTKPRQTIKRKHNKVSKSKAPDISKPDNCF